MRKFYTTCPHCEHQRRVRFWEWFFAPNRYSFWIHVLHPSRCIFPCRWLCCPACKKHSWSQLEDEIFVEGRYLMNESLRNVKESFKTLVHYVSEHRDEVVKEIEDGLNRIGE